MQRNGTDSGTGMRLEERMGRIFSVSQSKNRLDGICQTEFKCVRVCLSETERLCQTVDRMNLLHFICKGAVFQVPQMNDSRPK